MIKEGAGGLDPRLLARTAKRVEAAKEFARGQVAAGKSVSEKAMPLLQKALGGEKPAPREREPGED